MDKTLREQIAFIDKLIAHAQKMKIEHERRIHDLYRDREKYYCDSGLNPIRTEKEEAILRRMPRHEFDCEYCGADNVRKGKHIVCIDCGHLQGGPKEETNTKKNERASS